MSTAEMSSGGAGAAAEVAGVGSGRVEVREKKLRGPKAEMRWQRRGEEAVEGKAE